MSKCKAVKRRRTLDVDLQNETFGAPARGIKHPPSCPEGPNTPPTTTMDNSIAAIQNVEVKFLPPLHEQRRAWVLDVLRRESVTSVGPSSPFIVNVTSIYTDFVSHRHWTSAVARVSSCSISLTPRRGAPTRLPLPPQLYSKNLTSFIFATCTASTLYTMTFCTPSTSLSRRSSHTIGRASRIWTYRSGRAVYKNPMRHSRTSTASLRPKCTAHPSTHARFF